jgi:hypothetical protein
VSGHAHRLVDHHEVVIVEHHPQPGHRLGIDLHGHRLEPDLGVDLDDRAGQQPVALHGR